MKVTISGPPGSGKTTIAGLLSEKLGMEVITGGMIFRGYAEELGITLSELGKRAEAEEDFDRKLDMYQLEVLKTKDNIIVESRLSGWLCHINGIRAFKIFLKADDSVRIKRIESSLEEREGEQHGDIHKSVKERELSEWKRYNKYYNIDFNDVSIYDAVIDSSQKLPNEIVGVIIADLDIWKGTEGKIH